MSWPDDGEPRFIVTTLCGYLIVPGSTARGSGGNRPAVCAYVLDRAYCDRIVGRFEIARGNQWKRSSDQIGEAERLAARLNAAEAGDGEG